MYLAFDHFRSEEQLMVLLPPEDAEAHKQEHADLSAKLVELLIQRPSALVSVKPSELSWFFRQWLVDHIQGWDVPLASRLASK